MSRRGVHADLNAVRALVAEGRSRLDRAAAQPGQEWLTSVRDRLVVVDGLLVDAAGGVPRWVWGAIVVVPVALVVWAVTAVAEVIGIDPSWRITLAVVIPAGIEAGLLRLARRVTPAFNRRRLAQVREPRPYEVKDDDLREPLLQARVRLVSTVLRQVDSARWRSPYLRRLVTDETTMNRLAEADLALCQAVDHLEIFLDEKDTP